MTSETLRLKKTKVADSVEERLLARILGGDIKPGEALPSERELARDWEVGRPAIREAMQSLARKGIITINHGERAKVAPPSLDRLLEQFADGFLHSLVHSPQMSAHLESARRDFEGDLARKAAEGIAPEALAELRRSLDDQRQCLDDGEAFRDADGAFHRMVAGVCGNPLYAPVIQSVFRALSDYYGDIVLNREERQAALQEHTAITAAIETRNGAEASRLMHEHLSREQRNIQERRASGSVLAHTA